MRVLAEYFVKNLKKFKQKKSAVEVNISRGTYLHFIFKDAHVRDKQIFTLIHICIYICMHVLYALNYTQYYRVNL